MSILVATPTRRSTARFARMLAWMLLLSTACYQKPSTLGLVCDSNEQCDDQQICHGGACVHQDDANLTDGVDTQGHSETTITDESESTDSTDSTSTQEPRCPRLAPISCGNYEGAACCPRTKPFCCDNECFATAQECEDRSEFLCPKEDPNCTMCTVDGLYCPEAAPYCCDPGEDGVCYPYAGQCGKYHGNDCTETGNPISCADGNCCPDSRPFCCENGGCYADPAECGAQTEVVCVEETMIACGESGCCPASEPYCCPGEGEKGRCYADPYFCGLN